MIYDGDQLLADYDATGKLLARYVYGPGLDEPLVMLKAGKSYYFHADPLGSIIALTDSRGQIVERYTYDAFGTPTILAPDGTVRPTSVVGNRFLFTGREYDAETGLCYLRHRYYHPRLGRFLQREPDPTDLNPYRYTFNNPVNWTDPLGLNVFSPTPPAVTGPDVIGLGLPRGLGIDVAPPLPTPLTEWVPPLPNPPSGPDVLPEPSIGTSAHDTCIKNGTCDQLIMEAFKVPGPVKKIVILGGIILGPVVGPIEGIPGTGGPIAPQPKPPIILPVPQPGQGPGKGDDEKTKR